MTDFLQTLLAVAAIASFAGLAIAGFYSLTEARRTPFREGQVWLSADKSVRYKIILVHPHSVSVDKIIGEGPPDARVYGKDSFRSLLIGQRMTLER